MRHPWVNIALLLILSALLLTGFFGLITGAERGRWVLWLHGAGGYALILMLVWKGQVILGVFHRKPGFTLARLAFLVLLLITLGLLATGLFWTTSGPAYLAGFSLMTIHAVLGIALLILLAWHTVARRSVLRVRPARDRRAFLRFVGLVIAGTAVWQVSRSAKAALELRAAARRFTGSYQTGSFTGVFPVVSWLFDFPRPVDRDSWRLNVRGIVDRPLTLSYADLLNLAAETSHAIIDCTGGWYSEQEWRGVNLGRLLAEAGVAPNAASFTVVSVSGYSRRFPIEAAQSFILATHVAGQPLDHGHGYPVRLVASNHRGFDWVKWVVGVEVNTTSHLLQPPVHLQ
jgi:hypothetical protein